MQAATRCAGPILIVILATVIVTALTGVSVDQTNIFPVVAVLGVAILALVAGLKDWKTLPWLPWVGLSAAAAGYVANNLIWMNSSLFFFAVMTIWHEHQREREIRRNAPST